MLKKAYLMVPGPTNLPQSVLQAMDRAMINHRGPEYEEMFTDCTARLKKIFQTTGDVLTYPSAGTGVMEASIVNFLSPGDTVLVVSIGVFGNRFAEIAANFGLKVEKIDVIWGQPAEPEVLAEKLAQDQEHNIKAIYMTQNETSTGVTNDIAALMAVCRQHPALKIVDAVSALGAIPMKMDEWGIDVAITGSQKALMIPPGLGFMAVNNRAWQAYETAKLPKFYWDANKVKKSLAKGQNPYTPPVSLIFGLAESLRLIEQEGAEHIFRRHRILAKAMRAGVKALGLELLADKGASTVVTSVCAPKGVEGKQIQKIMRDKYGVTIAGGQKNLENKIIRIGHLGYVAPTDIIVTLSALEMALKELGVAIELGKGVQAAQTVFMEEL